MPNESVKPASILTEEELEEWAREPRELLPVVSDYRIKSLISAYRYLLSANAELSFKNMKYKKALETINNGSGSGKSVGASYREIAEKALEETK